MHLFGPNYSLTASSLGVLNYKNFGIWEVQVWKAKMGEKLGRNWLQYLSSPLDIPGNNARVRWKAREGGVKALCHSACSISLSHMFEMLEGRREGIFCGGWFSWKGLKKVWTRCQICKANRQRLVPFFLGWKTIGQKSVVGIMCDPEMFPKMWGGMEALMHRYNSWLATDSQSKHAEAKKGLLAAIWGSCLAKSKAQKVSDVSYLYLALNASC